jgi:hypothetical protein
MIITVEEGIDAIRSDLFDKADVDDDGNARDTLWSDPELLRYFNSACARWASDTLALRRRFEFAVAADQALVRFPYSEILDELNINFVVPSLGRRRTLVSFDLDDDIVMDDYGVQVAQTPDLDRRGTPTHYTRDYDNQFLRLWPIPIVAGTLSASAIVLPQQLYPGMPLPCSALQDFDLIALWVKKLAYAKQDADTLDLTRSMAFEAEYKRYVPDRRSEIDRNRRDGGVMKANR